MLDENQCKVLFTMTDERIYDDVPTVKELGYDCTSLSTYRGLAMSSKVDPAIVEYWDKIMEKVCEDPDFIAEADNMGLVIRFQNTDEALKTFSEYNPIWYDLKESLGMCSYSLCLDLRLFTAESSQIFRKLFRQESQSLDVF